MELKPIAAIGVLFCATVAVVGQTPPSTVNPAIPVANTPVEQSGPALRQNFLATMNDINALWAAIGSGGGGFSTNVPHTWTAVQTNTVSPLVPTASFGTNDTTAASTAFVQAANAGFFGVPHTWSGLQTFSSINVTPGPANVPTAVSSTNDTTAASTAFVQAQVVALTAAFNAKIRIKLAAPLTLFADSVNGMNGLGCGLAPGASACRTLQGAYMQLVNLYDTSGFTVTISFNNNDTTGLNITAAWTGAGQVIISGPGGSPPATGIATTGAAITVNAPLPANLNLINFKITSSGGQGIVNFAAATVNVGENMNFGAVGPGSPQIQLSGAGAGMSCNGVLAGGGYTISGGGGYHLQATTGGVIQCGSPITVTGTPAYTGAFANAFAASLLYTGTFTGGATGVRYVAQANGVIFTGAAGCGATFFPGNSAGVLQTGGQCI